VFYLHHLSKNHLIVFVGGAVSIQYVHIPNKEQCDRIRERVEIPEPWNYAVEEKCMILDRLIWSESFQNFIASKYPNEKRFSLECCEALIPGMKVLIDRSVDHGVKHVTIGMPHRGRLNVLGNVIRKPIETILNEFSGTDADNPAGDVKYHLRANYVRPTPSGKKVSLSLVANPSHLEAKDPVVLGARHMPYRIWRAPRVLTTLLWACCSTVMLHLRGRESYTKIWASTTYPTMALVVPSIS